MSDSRFVQGFRFLQQLLEALEDGLRKLIILQTQGKIARIYTQSMVNQLEADLKQLKREHGL